MRKRVFITNEVSVIAFQYLSRRFNVTCNKKQFNESQLKAKVRPFHGLLTTLADPVSKSVLLAAPLLKYIANFAVGYNNIDIQTAKERGIWITNTLGILTEAMADIAWALLLACARRLPEGERMVRAGKFKGWHPLKLLGLDVPGKTLGLFGFGRIGQAVARRGRGWGMKVLYHQRKRVFRSIEKQLNAKFSSFAYE